MTTRHTLVKSICIVGAGAIGLDLALHCIRSGWQVAVIAREPTYSVLQKNGIIKLNGHGKGESTAGPAEFQVFARCKDAGKYPLVFLTLKSDALLEVVADLPHLLNETSIVVSATNGIPPWYSYLQDATIGRFSFSREPRKLFLKSARADNLLGAIVLRSSDLAEPGIVAASGGRGFIIGELDHAHTERCKDLCSALTSTGLETTPTANIHRDIWLKLIGNVAVNPTSVVTQQTIGEMLQSPRVRKMMKAAARECEMVGLRLGILQPGEYNETKLFEFMANHLHSHRPSMLQDYLRGKPLEVHRILDVVEMLASAEGPVEPVLVPTITKLRTQLIAKTAARPRPNRLKSLKS